MSEPSDMDLSDSRLDRLLGGRDRLAVTEKEQILERILAQVPAAQAEPRARVRILRWAIALGAMAAFVPITLTLWNGRSRSEFTARGGGAEIAPSVEVACLDAAGQAAACSPGGRLLFRVTPGRFGAFAAVALSPDGKTFWYFPSEDGGVGVDLAASKQSGLLDQAIVLDGRHVPGDYQLYAVFSDRPLDKDQVRQAIRDPGALGAAVVRRKVHLSNGGAP